MWAPAVGGSRHGRFRTIVKFECERFGGVSCECGDKSCRRTDKERIIENFIGCIHEWRVSVFSVEPALRRSFTVEN